MPYSLMNALDYFATGFVIGALLFHERLLHAPNSSSVRRAVFRADGGGCYTLQPLIVDC